MTRPATQKEDLLAWVNAQRQLDTVTKFILHRLAQLADGECVAWAKVETLAEAVNKSERTIRYHLRDLESAGLIRKTGEAHRLANSTRSVPYYQIASGVEGFDPSYSMPAIIAGILPDAGGYACNSGGGMPAIGLQPHNELNGTEEDAVASSASVWDRAAVLGLMNRIRKAYPKRALGWSDPVAAEAELVALIQAGVDVEELPGCAARMAQDPAILRRDFGPPRMETWLARRQFEGWWPDQDASEPASAQPAADALPAWVVDALGADFVKAWLGEAAWIAETQTIVARLRLQRDKVRDVRADVLTKHSLAVCCRADLAQTEQQGAN